MARFRFAQLRGRQDRVRAPCRAIRLPVVFLGHVGDDGRRVASPFVNGERAMSFGVKWTRRMWVSISLAFSTLALCAAGLLSPVQADSRAAIRAGF
jgi:hypothetical protein